MEDREPRKLIDPSGHAVSSHTTGSTGIPALLTTPGIPGWTLVVLVAQTLAIGGQVWILSRQTDLMNRDALIQETQQKLATRPYVVTRMLDWGPINQEKPTRWRIENNGAYSIHDLRSRILDFQKFMNFGWRVISTNATVIAPVLTPGGHYDQNLQVLASMIKGTSGDLQPIQGAHLVVIEMTFNREGDDREYLYLQPLWVPDERTGPQPVEQWVGLSGPLDKACSISAYALELTYKFYARNPLPFSVELYNYHYLLGQPATTCLDSSDVMRP